MAEKRPKRKLTAILSADVKGYSRLMREDEVSTVETLKQYRQIISNLVVDYRGRVVDSPGTTYYRIFQVLWMQLNVR